MSELHKQSREYGECILYNVFVLLLTLFITAQKMYYSLREKYLLAGKCWIIGIDTVLGIAENKGKLKKETQKSKIGLCMKKKILNFLLKQGFMH